MQEVLLDDIKNIENGIKVKENINIIDLNDNTISVSIQIANALINNEIVVMMADRTANNKSKLAIEFLGKKANFNKNPFQIAYKTNKPLLVYFIVLVGIQKYKVVHTYINIDKTKTEKEAIVIALNQYVKKYEDMVKLYPNQWLNFYNFWENK
jgi:predicted LPLAT superfamily acyltransferase